MKIAYETICNAIKGNTEDMGKILAAYQPYIRTLATLKSIDVSGTKKFHLDRDAVQTLKKKLIEEIPKWKELCK